MVFETDFRTHQEHGIGWGLGSDVEGHLGVLTPQMPDEISGGTALEGEGSTAEFASGFVAFEWLDEVFPNDARQPFDHLQGSRSVVIDRVNASHATTQ